MLGSIAEMEFAREIARTSSFGLGEMLYRQMTGEPLPSVRPSRPATEQAVVSQPIAEKGGTPPRAVTPSSKGEAEQAPGAQLPGLRSLASPPDTVAERVNTYTPYVNEAAELHDLDPGLIKAVIAAESAGRPDALSSKSAKGLMQLIDSTAADLGVRDVWDPRENILAGAQYLRTMLDRFGGDVKNALASYNAGPGAVERHGGIPPFRETREYVQRVMHYLLMFGQEDYDGND